MKKSMIQPVEQTINRMISNATKERIIKRLQQENARSPYLNCLPGRIKSYSKLDLFYLQYFNSTLSNELPLAISTGKSITYYQDTEVTTSSIIDDSPIQKCIKTIVDKAKVIHTETGSETLSVGYPVLIERSSTSTTDCKAIPLFIWSVQIANDNVSNRWKFTFPKELPRINHSLIGFIESEKIPIDLQPLYDDFINEDLESINHEDLIERIENFIAKNNGCLSKSPSEWDVLEKVPFESKASIKEASEPGITFELYNSAVLTNYKESKYSIIKDFSHFDDDIPELSKASVKINDIPACSLDPSQFGVIEDINTLNHVVVHGPPGTGKSQTITGIITSALANNLKVAVICQKAAAIDVLIQNLADLNIHKEVLRITNVTSDRKMVIEKARSFENSTIPRTNPTKGITHDLEEYQQLASKVVKAHLKSREEFLAESFNWNQSVGQLSKIKRLYPSLISFDYSELGRKWYEDSNQYKKNSEELDDLYSELQHFGDLTQYLNTSFDKDSPLDDLRDYEQQVNTLLYCPDRLLKVQREDIFQIQKTELDSVTTKLNKTKENFNIGISIVKKCEDHSLGYPWLEKDINLGSFETEVLENNITLLNKAQVRLKTLINDVTLLNQSEAFTKYNTIGGLKRLFASFSSKYKTFKKVRSDLSVKAQMFNSNLEIQELIITFEKLNLIINLQEDLLVIARNYPIGIRVLLDQLKKDQVDLVKDLEKNNDFEYIGTSSFIGIRKYFDTFERNNKAKTDLRCTKRLLNSLFVDTVINSPEEASEILLKIKEKGLHLDGVQTLFQKDKSMNSPMCIHERTGITFYTEYLYGVLTYCTSEYFRKNQRHLPRKSFNNTLAKQENNLLVVQKQVGKVALYKSAVRRVNSINEIENRAASLASVFAHRGRNKKTLRQIAQKYTDEFTEMFPVMMMTPEVTCNLFEAMAYLTS